VEIKPDRMISLGYGKYWRSDAIVGLMRIEDQRGPGRRTEVYTATVDAPIVASRSERAILQDMAVATEDLLRLQESRETLSDLTDALQDVPDVLKRMLTREGGFDVDTWVTRLRTLFGAEPVDAIDQNDLFDNS
jgi:hypothetical protein